MGQLKNRLFAPGFNQGIRWSTLLLLFILISACTSGDDKKQASQNPSPMTENIRPHIRVSAEECGGERINWELDDKSVQLFIPEDLLSKSPGLIIHFHGMAKVSEYAVCGSSSMIMATVNGGSGGSSYERLFKENNNFQVLLKTITDKSGFDEFSSLTLSGWSAGYGAIRAVIRKYEDQIDNVILLDGLHTSYIPDRMVLYEGGQLDSTKLDIFLPFAEKAISGDKTFLITHTSIFPGTFASTTECTDYLIRKLGLSRKPVLKPGPVGSQQVGEVAAGNFNILSFAGNTAPDHVDHLHALKTFLNFIK